MRSFVFPCLVVTNIPMKPLIWRHTGGPLASEHLVHPHRLSGHIHLGASAPGERAIPFGGLEV